MLDEAGVPEARREAGSLLSFWQWMPIKPLL
jgi:hypothetical protein